MSDNNKFRAKTIIEILGKPKEHVEETLKTYVKALEKDVKFKIISSEFADAEEQEQDELFSAFAELEIETNELEHLFGFCFDYMPASIDIIEPENLTILSHQLNTIVNDLQGKLHTLDMAVKQLKNENNFLKQNTNTLINNLLRIMLIGKKLTKEQLSQGTGISNSELSGFLDQLHKDKKLGKEGDKYFLQGDS